MSNWAEFSESSYAFAVTKELTESYRLLSPPVFPSTYQEGKKGGGYDVMLPVSPKPLFIQFKIQEVLMRRTGGLRDVDPDFPSPFNRFKIRANHPNQHKMLCDLESQGNSVWYVSPYFSTVKEFEKFYRSKSTVQNSVFVSPEAIGNPPPGKHHFAYHSDLDYGWALSKPILVETKSFGSWLDAMISNFASGDGIRLLDLLKSVGIQLIQVLEMHEIPFEIEHFEECLRQEDPFKLWQYVNTISLAYFDCYLFFHWAKTE